LSKPIASIFATRLKAARELRGLSQRALGGLVSESKSNGSVRINRYEQGVNRADMDTAAALAEALGVPLAYLFAEKDDQAELLLTFAKLPSGDRAKLLALAKQMAEKRDRKGTKSP
jgi:transcriptional regulator with XRE-family HTH domain